MERHFETQEEAEIYAARMRSEGYRADVLGESIPTLWGAAALGDVRVIVYDAGELEDDSPAPSRATDLAERIFYGIVIGAMTIVLGWLAMEITAYLFRDGVLGAVYKVLILGCLLYTLSAWSLLLAAFFRKRHDRRSKLGLIAHAVVSLIATVLALTLLVSDIPM